MRFWSSLTRFVALAFLLVCLALNALGQSDKALLWKITGPDLSAPSYLFGTYHLLTDNFFNTLTETAGPLKAAKGVVVETIIDSARIANVAGIMVMPGQKISNLVTPADFKLVSDEVEQTMGVSLAQFDQMKPLTIALMITMGYAQKGNAETLARYAGKPMDYHIAATGKWQAKTVTQLETMEEQFKLLYDAFPVEEQARQLVALVKQKEFAATAQVKLLELYLAKDMPGLHAYAESMPKDFGNSDFLLKNRNERWMNVLPGLMKKEAQFIAVGALHLPGPHGLIALLRKAGYTAVPITQ
jgi:uncharacterized protein YbaP (TraB family)